MKPSPVVADAEAAAFEARLATLDQDIERSKAAAEAAARAHEEAKLRVAAAESVGAAVPLSAPEAQQDAAISALAKAQAGARIAELRLASANEAATTARTARRNAVAAEHQRRMRNGLEALTARRIAVAKDIEAHVLALGAGLKALFDNQHDIIAFAGGGFPRSLAQHLPFWNRDVVMFALRNFVGGATDGLIGDYQVPWGRGPGTIVEDTEQAAAMLLGEIDTPIGATVRFPESDNVVPLLKPETEQAA